MVAQDVLRRFHVTVRGDAGAPTLLFTNGFGTDQTIWDQVTGELLSGHRVVTWDMAGTGRSDPATYRQHRYLSLRAYANDLVQIAAALELSAATAIGHSVGAMVNLLAAIERPPAFGKLVLMGSSPCYREEPGYHGGLSRESIDQIYSHILHNYPGWVDGYAPQMIGDPQAQHLIAQLTEGLKGIPKENALTTACAIFQSDHRADLPKVAHPTLILQTKVDAVVPREVAEYLHAHLPVSRLEIIDAIGHLPHLTAPAAVVRAIQGFLREADGRGPT